MRAKKIFLVKKNFYARKKNFLTSIKIFWSIKNFMTSRKSEKNFAMSKIFRLSAVTESSFFCKKTKKNWKFFWKGEKRSTRRERKFFIFVSFFWSVRRSRCRVFFPVLNEFFLIRSTRWSSRLNADAPRAWSAFFSKFAKNRKNREISQKSRFLRFLWFL